MNIKKFWKLWALFALAAGLVLAGCDFISSEEEEEESGGSENSGGSGGSSSGVPALVEGEWTDGTISKNGQTDTYSIEVSKGTRYFVYLNDTDDGDGTKTADMGLKIYHSDGTAISSSYNSVQSCWEKPFTFLAPSDGTITITAASYGGFSGWEYGVGTYAIKYTSRPEYDVLSNGEWKEDRIIANGQTNKYSIEVSKGTRYFVYLNDADDGDGTKTADMGLKIYHSDGTAISSSYSSVQSCWEKPFTFLAPSDGTITITAASYGGFSGWEYGVGTYAIRCTSRPEYDALSDGEWKNDSIIATGQTNKYSINVVAGTQYSIYLNDGYEGDGSKTANRIGLKIIYTQDSNSDNPVICNNYSNACKLYVKPYTFTAPSTGTIIITAAVYSSGWEKGIGTYAIKYMSGS